MEGEEAGDGGREGGRGRGREGGKEGGREKQQMKNFQTPAPSYPLPHFLPVTSPSLAGNG
jgi:hypothetical protein